ncbi:hypothetical protein [Pseudomonas fluorescens]|uniref:Uncharacterized protein n=1 Tax=Pseudomonas fluorescens TaxID=294 RepID=A0AAE2DLC1_PSEFL|nr:hypothetical protein [Pseudomonas fluorescens]KIF60488.1 hypothetical protein QS95_13480 [Pseudomonas fluorescens]
MEIIVDLYGTSETEQDAKNKAESVLEKAGKIVSISSVQLNPENHSATVTYTLEKDPNYVPSSGLH